MKWKGILVVSRPVKRGKVLVNTHYFSQTCLSFYRSHGWRRSIPCLPLWPSPLYTVFCLKTGYLDQLSSKARFTKSGPLWDKLQPQTKSSHEDKMTYLMPQSWEMGHPRGRGEGMLGRQSSKCPLHLPANAGSQGKQNGLMRKS